MYLLDLSNHVQYFHIPFHHLFATLDQVSYTRIMNPACHCSPRRSLLYTTLYDLVLPGSAPDSTPVCNLPHGKYRQV